MAANIKTFMISLERATQRRNYIKQHLEGLKVDFQIIEAVDGNQLTPQDIEKYCDVEAVNKSRYWLNNGAIGCALSHLKAYQEFLKTTANFAFIIEDDAVLPKNIKTILKEITEHIDLNEVVLLYYTSFKPAKFSNINKLDLTESCLCYPMDIKQPITITAYIIGRQAATNMANEIIPIKVAADSWSYYFDKGCFDSFRVQFPMSVKTKNFKSSIDYFEKDSLKSKVLSFVDKYKVFVFYQILALRRKWHLNKMLGHFELTNKISPIDRGKSSQ